MMRMTASSLAICILLIGCGGSTAQRSVERDAITGLQWTGRFQSQLQRSGEVSPRGQVSAEGNITLMETRNERVRVTIRLSAPRQQSTSLRWAVLSGQCGSASMPVLSYQQFPMIEMGSNGRGQLDVELPLTLEVTTTYHANIYMGSGNQLSDLVSCANLRLR